LIISFISSKGFLLATIIFPPKQSLSPAVYH
jgi:hypothetical protein